MNNKKIGALVRTSLVDFPGMICASLFLKHCNLRCPYCYNGQLVTDTEKEENLVTMEEVLEHLNKRKNVLSGFVISGGEALLFPHLKQLISEAKKLGYKIKLDTNGTLPESLKELIEDKNLCPDFIAMDLKTSPEKYHSFLNARKLSDPIIYETSLAQSVKLISTLPPEQREFRTVLVPTLIKEDDIKKIAALLPADASWRFAQFSGGNCLEPLYNALQPYNDKEAERLVSIARTLIKDSCLR